MLRSSAEIEQIPHGQVQLPAHPFQNLERGCVDTPLNEAQEIDADADQLRKLLLSQLAFMPDRPETISKMLAERRHPGSGCTAL